MVTLLVPLLLAAADAGTARPPPWRLNDVTFSVVHPFDPVAVVMGRLPRTFTFRDGRVAVVEGNDATDYALSASADAGLPAFVVQDLGSTSWGHHVGSDEDTPARVASWEWLDDERVRTNLEGPSVVLTRRDEQVDVDAFASQLINAVLPEGSYTTEDGVVLSVGADGGVAWPNGQPGRVSACYLSCAAKERWNVCVAARGEQWVFVEEAGRVVGLTALDSDLDCDAVRTAPGRVLRGPPNARRFKRQAPLVSWPAFVKPNELVATGDELGGARLLKVLKLGQTRVRTACGSGTVVSVNAAGATVRNNDTGEARRFVLRAGALVPEVADDCGPLRAAVTTGRWRER